MQKLWGSSLTSPSLSPSNLSRSVDSLQNLFPSISLPNSPHDLHHLLLKTRPARGALCRVLRKPRLAVSPPTPPSAATTRSSGTRPCSQAGPCSLAEPSELPGHGWGAKAQDREGGWVVEAGQREGTCGGVGPDGTARLHQTLCPQDPCCPAPWLCLPPPPGTVSPPFLIHLTSY